MTTASQTSWSSFASCRILERLAEDDYWGWDPYDALAAPRVRAGAGTAGLPARLLTQVVKRSPIPLEPALGIPRTRSAYTLGESLTAISRLASTSAGGVRRAEAARLVADLKAAASLGYSGLSWGSAVDVATRFAFFPKSVPNVVVTAFVARGLAEATERRLVDCREEIHAVATFITEALPTQADQTGVHYGYSPQLSEVILNSNMLAAMTLADAGRILGRGDLTEKAVAAARFVVARQDIDGGWPYSDRGSAAWVDGFHTSFVLQGLVSVLQAKEDASLRDSYQRGLRFYCASLLAGDGLPRFSAVRPWPVDCMCASQAVELLQRAGETSALAQRLLERVLHHVARSFVGRHGRVAYQVHRFWTDWRWFPRWSAAPMAAALAGVAAVPMGIRGLVECADAGSR